MIAGDGAANLFGGEQNESAGNLINGNNETYIMKTMIDPRMPEIASSTAHPGERPPTHEPRELLLIWLIVGALLVLAYLVFRLAMLELDLHGLLDELLAWAGRPCENPETNLPLAG